MQRNAQYVVGAEMIKNLVIIAVGIIIVFLLLFFTARYDRVKWSSGRRQIITLYQEGNAIETWVSDGFVKEGSILNPKWIFYVDGKRIAVTGKTVSAEDMGRGEGE